MSRRAAIAIVIAAPALSAATCSPQTPISVVRDVLPRAAVAVRDACKQAGDDILDARDAHAIDDATAEKRLGQVFDACAKLGAGVSALDQGTRALAGVSP